ncbi:MAG: hypothetical protein HQL25_01145 [Candidatus Omnitrophica bacterium]|nr:hypothetical protein [Candidatus Omnitrophota bacterium]
MPAKVKRNKFFRFNQYQFSIIMITFVPMLIIALTVTFLVRNMHMQAIVNLIYGSSIDMVHFIEQAAFVLLVTVWSMFVLTVFIAFTVSSRLVGGFERIIRELDSVIEHKYPDQIIARKKDKLAYELVTRINKIIAQHPKKKN